jgi:hypothetical protein
VRAYVVAWLASRHDILLLMGERGGSGEAWLEYSSHWCCYAGIVIGGFYLTGR